MRRAYKFRLKPTKSQAVALEAQLSAHCYLYNCALQQRRDAWLQQQVSVTFAQQSAELPAIRREIAGFAQTNASSCQHTLRRLDRAFQAFFRRVKAGEKQAGYPRFRSRHRFDSVTFTIGDGTRWNGHAVYFQHVGDVRAIQHRPVEGTIKQISFKREAGREWYAVLSCDLGDVAVPASPLPPVGLDMGLKTLYATSDGETVPAPQHYRQAQRALRRAQRALSRKQRGSQRRNVARQRVARLHAKVARQRADFQYKAIAGLVRRYGVFVVENLNRKGMAKSRLAKSINDAAWGAFLDRLKSKAEEAGAQVIEVDPRHTSQTCGSCGHRLIVSLTLKDRVFRCEACGVIADRDVNAAQVILQRAAVALQAPTPAVVGVS